MKRVLFGFLFALAITSVGFFSSCDDDDDYEIWGTIATARPANDNLHSFYLVLDDGTTLIPDKTSGNYNPKENQRAVVYFEFLSDKVDGYDHKVRIDYLRDILTKKVVSLTEENSDYFSEDPVKILKMWIGDDFLNIKFGYNGTGQKIHYINMVNNTTAGYPDDGKTHLEFRHNSNGDPAQHGYNGFVAFDLRPYQSDNRESVDFVIKVRDFGEIKEYNVNYNYKDKTVKVNRDGIERDFDASQYE